MALALLFPFSVNAIHIFSHDDHNHCTETGTVHFHEKEIDCELCDFHLTTILHFSKSNETNFYPPNYKTIFPPLEEPFLKATTLYFNLRGPPVNA
tara:strand:+ start:274004 stop:274288 length:285 start_codon:yes stop_codon:yes gene_type:complete